MPSPEQQKQNKEILKEREERLDKLYSGVGDSLEETEEEPDEEDE